MFKFVSSTYVSTKRWLGNYELFPARSSATGRAGPARYPLGWKAMLVPPKDSLTRVRWPFLLSSLIAVLPVSALALATFVANGWLRVVMVVGSGWLCWRWMCLYRRETYSAVEYVPEGLALLALGMGVGDLQRALSVFYLGMYFRSLYGSGGSIIRWWCVYLAAYVGAVIWTTGATTLLSSTVLTHAFGYGCGASLVHVMATALLKHEQAVARERILREAGAALVAALDRSSMYTATLNAAHTLVHSVTGTSIALMVGPSDDMVVVGTRGIETQLAPNTTLDLHPVLQHVQPHLPAAECVAHAQLVAWEHALGCDLGGKVLFVVPLLIQQELRGTLLISSQQSLPRELKVALETLGSQVALALESAALTEEVHRRQSEAWFQSLVQNASDVIAILEADGTLRYQSPAVKQVLGYTAQALLGHRLFEWIHPDDVPRAQTLFAQALTKPEVNITTEYRLRHANGSWRTMEAIANNLLADPGVAGIVVTSRDITERKEFEAQLTRLAFYDQVSQLPNRALFMDRLMHALARADRQDRAVAVLFVDLDNFKIINDSLGHGSGDQVLVRVAQCLQACVRPADTVARLGGDEFTILVEDVTCVRDAIIVAERIAEQLHAAFTVDGHEVVATASVGVAVSAPGITNSDDLVRNADLAMYGAKINGKGRYYVFDTTMTTHAMDRLKLEIDLRHALERHELRLFYQPIIALNSQLIIGMEALIRWQHPQRGMVAPAAFIPLAEETGLILPIGQWVLEEACRQACVWQTQYPSPVPLVMSVNLSARQFEQPTLVQDIEEALRKSGMQPQMLKLEITESVIMHHAETVSAKLNELKTLGIQLAIDDFGTGYSSLAYLKRFPIDTLKIDRSFVKSIAQSAEDVAIVRTIMSLAKTLGLDVTAEGIETAEQLTLLQTLGSDSAQGFFCAKPLPCDEIAMLLAQQAAVVVEPTIV